MALQSNDSDIRPASLCVLIGGNGDYYVTIVEEKDQYNENGQLISGVNVLSSVRVSTSGGPPSEIIAAVSSLYHALEKHGLNKHPFHE